MLLVVGGQSRNVGKTSVVAGLVRRLRERRWTAVKITQYGHGVCSRTGEPCGCEAPAGDDAVSLTEEYEAGRSDSGRFLAAGAARSFWLRTPAGEISRAAGLLRKIVDQNENVIVESNSILEVMEPDLFLMLLDFGCADFKASSLRFLDRAGAFLVVDRGINVPLWEDLARGVWDRKPLFAVKPPGYLTAAVVSFVRSTLPPLSRQ